MQHLAEAAVRAGRYRLVGVGGDGTHHDILNGIIAADALDRVLYVLLPLGSGNDWVRTLGTPRRSKDWVNTLRRGRIMKCAVGWVRLSPGPFVRERGEVAGGTDEAGKVNTKIAGYRSEPQPVKKYFLNVAGLAYDANVLRRVEAGRFKNRLMYPLATLAGLPDFTAPTVRIEYEGKRWTGAVHTVNLGIGRYSGGGMRLVPQADPTADTLALTFTERLPAWRIVAESWRFYTGSIGRVKGVTLTRAKSIRITPLSGRLELEADGEWLGQGTVEAGLLEGRLRVIS